MPTEAKTDVKPPSSPKPPKKEPVVKAVPLPLSMQWTVPLLDKAEKMIVECHAMNLVEWAFPQVQGYGLVQPAKALGENIDDFGHKLRAALLTDGNTKLRQPIRTLGSYLALYAPAYHLDPRLLAQALVKTAVPDALGAIASATISKMNARETGDNS